MNKDAQTILNKWLDENKEMPYPTKKDVAALVQQTGLDAKKVKKWLDNTRRRRNLVKSIRDVVTHRRAMKESGK